jgi:hypothetical protein
MNKGGACAASLHETPRDMFWEQKKPRLAIKFTCKRTCQSSLETSQELMANDGIRSIENKKIPTARMNNNPRSNLEDGSNEKIMILTLEDFQSLRD